MTDTIERLVRILDEERRGHHEARQHIGNLAQRLSSEERANQRAQADATEARKKIEELERWIDDLHDKVPSAKRQFWEVKPRKFDEIPF